MVVWSSIFRAGIKPAAISTLLKPTAVQQSSKYGKSNPLN